MKFEIDFNKEDDDKTLLKIGAKEEYHSMISAFYIEIENFTHLEAILGKVEEIKGEYYYAVIGYDNPTIYLDKDI